MSEHEDQLIETLERPFPAPRRFGWLRVWRRESATSAVLSLIVAIGVPGVLLVGRLQWPGSGLGVPSVEITGVSLSAAERTELALSEPSASTASAAQSAALKTPTVGVERTEAVKVSPKGKTLSEAPSGEAGKVLADSDAVTDQALQRIKLANSELKALAETITIGDGSSKLRVKPGDGKSAEFFGIKTAGQRFVYVIDRSGSMASGDQRFPKANRELLTSVMRLRSRQQFFVYYFNTAAHPMPGGSSLVKADRNAKQRLYNWMEGVLPAGGTDPSSSLKLAVEMKPDAVFLLTDGEFSSFAQQLLHQINPPGRNQVSINTVAIVSRVGEQQLRQIAAENKGAYRFVP